MRAVQCKVAWGGAVSHLWAQRNNYIHGGHPKTEESIMQLIKWEVRAHIAGRANFKNSVLNRALCCSWGSLFHVLFKNPSINVCLVGSLSCRVAVELQGTLLLV